MSIETVSLSTTKDSVSRTEEEKLNARTKRVTDVIKGVAVAYVGLQLGLAAVRFIGRRLRGQKSRSSGVAKPLRQQSTASGAPYLQPAGIAAAGEDSWTPVDAPVPATPDGYKPIVTAILSCSPQELYGILFSSSGTDLYLKQHREVGKQWDVAATAWRCAPPPAGSDADNGMTTTTTTAGDDASLLGSQSVFEWVLGQPGSGGFTRLLTFWNPRKPPSSTDTRCVQRQQFRVYRGGVLLFATAMNMLDIPFKDCFTVNSFWRVEPGTRPGTTALTVNLKVQFIKRALGVGGIISATTIRDSASFYTVFMVNIETHINAIRQQAAAPLPAPLPASAVSAASATSTGMSIHGPRLSRSSASRSATVSPFAALAGTPPPLPAAVPATGAAAAAGVAPLTHLRPPLPVWKLVRALLVFAVLAFTLLHQLHLGRELAALRGESGGAAAASSAADPAADTAGAARGGAATAAAATAAAAAAIGRDGPVGALVSSALGSLLTAAGGAHWLLQGVLDRMGMGVGGKST